MTGRTYFPADADDNANGNLTSDGVNTYVWNARNQLSQITVSGTVQANYTYDALGRRTAKDLGGAMPTQYLYDGANAVQETLGSTINPILAGLGTDERFARNDVTGRTYFLADALGSTIGLTDPTGAIRQQYSYDPYGNATQTNNSTGFTNPYQYTGREADGPGLYYYRARYYSSAMERFISEDPLGFGGGQNNFYAYVLDNPINYHDPYGLWAAIAPAYEGLGGGFVVAGHGWHICSFSFRFGIGIGGGVSINPFGEPLAPGAPSGSNSIGVNIEGAIDALVVGAGGGWSGGGTMNPNNPTDWTGYSGADPALSFGKGRGAIGLSIGT